MTTNLPPLRPWHALNGREQAVWGVAFAAHAGGGAAAAQHADRMVATMATIQWPERESPVHRAARLCPWLTRDAFTAWYVVEQQLLSPGRVLPTPSEAELAAAYEAFARSGSDFY